MSGEREEKKVVSGEKEERRIQKKEEKNIERSTFNPPMAEIRRN